MTVSRYLAALLLATVAVCAAQAEEAAQGDSVIDKTGRAIGKGAKATADGAEYVAEKVVKGVKRGANATGNALDRAGHATGRALGTAANKVGLTDNSKSGNTAAPAGDSTGSNAKP